MAQLKLSPNEINRLNRRVEDDYNHAISAHGKRMERFRRYYQLWRNRVDPPEIGDEDASNFSVPLMQWQARGKLATDMSSLLGADAEIIAKPTGPSDQKSAAKVGRFMTWRMFQSMKIVNDLIIWDLWKILFGKVHAYGPYKRETFTIKDLESGMLADVVDYEGPGFTRLWPDEFICPVEEVKTVHEFSWVMRRYRISPGELLRGQMEGRFFGIKENFQKILDFTENHNQREYQGEEIQREKDLAEGIEFESVSGRGQLVVHEWYGRWRMLSGKKDARENNLEGRNDFESDLVVSRLPEMNMVVGCQDLMDSYPRMKNRRPFVEAALSPDGSYWSPGFGELLESIQDESSANHNLMAEAGEFTVGPLIFAKAGSGVTTDKFRYGPREVIVTEDPAGVNVVAIHPNLEYAITKEQSIMRYAERVTGVSDLSLGRSSDQPNQPRTARGTIAILEQGNIRASLDTTVLREDVALLAQHIWELDSELSPESVFFRVTEEDANGLFDVKDGGAFMTSKERAGRYDFDIKFATSVWSREAKKDDQLALYQLDMQNPLIATNPLALWRVTNGIHVAMGDDNFCDVIPEPPDPGNPVKPAAEWNLALQGESFHVHPMDDDAAHIQDHTQRMTEMKAGDKDDYDQQAMNLIGAHVIEHKKAQRIKMLMQALSGQLAQQLASNGQNGGIQMPAQPTGLQDAHAAIGSMIGQPSEEQAPPGGTSLAPPGKAA